MPIVSFRIILKISNRFPMEVLGARLRDFSPIWPNIRDAWLRHNQDKFDQSKGQQDTGVFFEMGAGWLPVTPKYSGQKSWEGYDDWLMVRTGELMSDMTYGAQEGSANWFEYFQEKSAMFGSTNEKIAWNWWKNGELNRPVQFLDRRDRIMITSEIGQWVNNGAKYMDGGGKQSMASAIQEKQMDAEFDWLVDSENT